MKEKPFTNFPLPISLVLLAGGKGSRMGGNKLYLSINGEFLVKEILNRLSGLFTETIVVTAPGESERAILMLGPFISEQNISIVEDTITGVGPLEGLARGLESMKNDWCFLLGCDMPCPQKKVICKMASYISSNFNVIAVENNGEPEPLHAFYSRKTLSTIRKRIKDGNRKVKSVYNLEKVLLIKSKDLSNIENFEETFLNLNTPEDVKKLKKKNL